MSSEAGKSTAEEPREVPETGTNLRISASDLAGARGISIDSGHDSRRPSVTSTYKEPTPPSSGHVTRRGSEVEPSSSGAWAQQPSIDEISDEKDPSSDQKVRPVIERDDSTDKESDSPNEIRLEKELTSVASGGSTASTDKFLNSDPSVPLSITFRDGTKMEDDPSSDTNKSVDLEEMGSPVTVQEIILVTPSPQIPSSISPPAPHRTPTPTSLPLMAIKRQLPTPQPPKVEHWADMLFTIGKYTSNILCTVHILGVLSEYVMDISAATLGEAIHLTVFAWIWFCAGFYMFALPLDSIILFHCTFLSTVILHVFIFVNLLERAFHIWWFYVGICVDLSFVLRFITYHTCDPADYWALYSRYRSDLRHHEVFPPEAQEANREDPQRTDATEMVPIGGETPAEPRIAIVIPDTSL